MEEEIRFTIFQGFVYLVFLTFVIGYGIDLDQPLIQVESDPRNKSVPILEPF